MKSLTPYNFGKKYLVENCQKIKIKDLLAKCQLNFKEIILKSEIKAKGVKIELATSKTHYNGVRFWLKCPLCGGRVGVLYQHPIKQILGCRGCLRLEYRSRRYKGMIESRSIL